MAPSYLVDLLFYLQALEIIKLTQEKNKIEAICIFRANKTKVKVDIWFHYKTGRKSKTLKYIPQVHGSETPFYSGTQDA